MDDYADSFRRYVRASLKAIKWDKLRRLIDWAHGYRCNKDEGHPIFDIYADEVLQAHLDQFPMLIAFGSIKNYWASHYEKRLALMVWALRSGRIASELHPTLPGKPGVMSAHALATMYSDMDRYMPNGAFAPTAGAYSPQGKGRECDPVANGIRWLTRLRSDVAKGKERGEFISQLLAILDQSIANNRFSGT